MTNDTSTPRAPRDPQTPAPAEALGLAAALSSRARQSTRWYGHFLLVFAAGSFVISVLTGALTGHGGVLVTTLLWLGFLAVILVWASRKKTSISGMTRLHLVVMIGWGLAWAATVFLGERYFTGQLWWWVVGGLAVALSPVVGAVVAFRRSA